MANRPHILTMEEIKTGAVSTGLIDPSVLGAVIGADVLTGQVRVIPDMDTVYDTYTLIADEEVIIIDPTVSVSVYIDNVIQSDLVITNNPYGLITSVRVVGSLVGMELLLVRVISPIHIDNDGSGNAVLQYSYAGAFTFYTGGSIRPGTTIEHRVIDAVRFRDIEIYCTGTPNGQINVDIKRDGVVVASASLLAGQRYSTTDLGLGFLADPSQELIAVVSTSTTTGTNLRIRIK